MPTTLPSFTRTMDNAFLTTWYDIKKEAIDNILSATVIWAVLTGAGCMHSQEGGDLITRTLKYGEAEAIEVEKGDTLPQGEKELETMAIWTFRNIATHVQRNLIDDRKNRGPTKIKDYVGQKLEAARDALEQRLEVSATNAIVTAETGKLWQGLHDMIPPSASRSTGTYGGIARPSAYVDMGNGVFKPDPAGTNGWWGPRYRAGTLASIEDDLLTEWKKLYNSVHANQSPPNLILTTQTEFEIYEEFALDAVQIIKDESTRLADLGFEVLRFKGKPVVWTEGMTANHTIFANTDYIEVVYDPGMWFDMTEWKPTPLQMDRIAHILLAGNMISTQLRRHGRLQWA